MKPANLSRGFWALFWLAVAFTLVMALLPQPPAVPLPGGDKVLHMTAFAVLSLLACLAFPRRRPVELFVGLAALGALIEVLQMVPALRRDAEFGDWIADCLALAITLAIVAFARKLAGAGGLSSADPS